MSNEIVHTRKKTELQLQKMYIKVINKTRVFCSVEQQVMILLRMNKELNQALIDSHAGV